MAIQCHVTTMETVQFLRYQSDAKNKLAQCKGSSPIIRIKFV